MSELAGLIRQFPEGSFIIILALIWAVERMVVHFVNRNRPVITECDCDCESEEEEE